LNLVKYYLDYIKIISKPLKVVYLRIYADK